MKTAADIQQHITALIEEIKLGAVPATQIRADDRLIQDLGLDSLDYATVLLGSEKWLGVKVREEAVDWSAIQTVGQLADFLAQQQQPTG